jgi:hypothetical protein
MNWDEARGLLPAHTQFSADSFAVASPFSAALRMIRNLISIGKGSARPFPTAAILFFEKIYGYYQIEKEITKEINSCKAVE